MVREAGGKSFAKIFKLSEGVKISDINKCLFAGMLIGRAIDITKLTSSYKPGLSKDIFPHFISNYIGQFFPGLEEKFTKEQAEALDIFFRQYAKLFSNQK